MLEMLKPIFRGPWASYGEGLRCEEHAPGTLQLADLLGSQDRLGELLAQQAQLWRTDDPRPVASAWMLKYTTLLLPPVAAATTLLQHVLPVASNEVALKLDAFGTPQAIVISHLGCNATGQDTASRYATLLERHLNPLIISLSAVSKLPAKILWGNVARRLDAILAQAKALAPSPALAAMIEADREHLLYQQTWGNGQRNPLHTQQKTGLRNGPKGQTHVLLHRQCCLNYLLPKEAYCGACPLSPEFRSSGTAPCPLEP